MRPSIARGSGPHKGGDLATLHRCALWGVVQVDLPSSWSARRATWGETRPGPSSAQQPWLPRPAVSLPQPPLPEARVAGSLPRRPSPVLRGHPGDRGREGLAPHPSGAAPAPPPPWGREPERSAWHEVGPGPQRPARPRLSGPSPARPHPSPASWVTKASATSDMSRRAGGRRQAEGTDRNWAPRRRGSNCIRGPPRPRRPGRSLAPATPPRRSPGGEAGGWGAGVCTRSKGSLSSLAVLDG